MKSFLGFSAPIRYLAYATLLVMLLCIVLEHQRIIQDRHPPESNAGLCFHHEEDNHLKTDWFKDDTPWNISLATAFPAIQNKLKRMLSSYLYKSPFERFCEMQPSNKAQPVQDQQNTKLGGAW